MKKSFYPNENYFRAKGSIKELQQREPSLPNFGYWEGPAGRGKTETLEKIYGEMPICYVRLNRVWSVRDVLEAMCFELRIAPEYRTSARFVQVIKESRRQGATWIFDEADYLFRDRVKLDAIRDFGDAVKLPLIFVGMEEFSGKLQKYPQFWSRILPAAIVEFKPLSVPEMVMVTKEWTGLDLIPEAAEALCRQTEGDFRYIIGYLLELERACVVNKTQEISPPIVERLVAKIDRKQIFDRFKRADIKSLRTVGRKP